LKSSANESVAWGSTFALFLSTFIIFCLLYMFTSFYTFHYDNLFLDETKRNLNYLEKKYYKECF
jgi:hypothetical protein